MLKAVLLEESITDEPTEDEVMLYAESLGIDVENEPDLLHIAKEGISAHLPTGWQVLKDENDQIFYYDTVSGISLWEHPLDKHFRDCVVKARQSKLDTTDTTSNPDKISCDKSVEADRILSNGSLHPRCKQLTDNKQSQQRYTPTRSDSHETKLNMMNTPKVLAEKHRNANNNSHNNNTSNNNNNRLSTTTTTLNDESHCQTPIVTTMPNTDLHLPPLFTDDPTEYHEIKLKSKHKSHKKNSFLPNDNYVQLNLRKNHLSSEGFKYWSEIYKENLRQADENLTVLQSKIRESLLLTHGSHEQKKTHSNLLYNNTDTNNNNTTTLDSFDKYHSPRIKTKQSIKCFSSSDLLNIIVNADADDDDHHHHHEAYNKKFDKTFNEEILCPQVGVSPTDLSNRESKPIHQGLASFVDVNSKLLSSASSSTSASASSVHRENIRNPSTPTPSPPQPLPPPPTSTTNNNDNHHHQFTPNTTNSLLIEQKVTPSTTHTTTNTTNIDQSPSNQNNNNSNIKLKSNNNNNKNLINLSECISHLVDERSRVQGKLFRLKLLYKTYKRRLENLDASLLALQEQTINTTEQSYSNIQSTGKNVSSHKINDSIDNQDKHNQSMLTNVTNEEKNSTAFEFTIPPPAPPPQDSTINHPIEPHLSNNHSPRHHQSRQHHHPPDMTHVKRSMSVPRSPMTCSVNSRNAHQNTSYLPRSTHQQHHQRQHNNTNHPSISHDLAVSLASIDVQLHHVLKHLDSTIDESLQSHINQYIQQNHCPIMTSTNYHNDDNENGDGDDVDVNEIIDNEDHTNNLLDIQHGLENINLTNESLMVGESNDMNKNHCDCLSLKNHRTYSPLLHHTYRRGGGGVTMQSFYSPSSSSSSFNRHDSLNGIVNSRRNSICCTSRLMKSAQKTKKSML